MLITLETALLAKEKGFVMNSCTFYQHTPEGAKRYELVGEDSEDEGFVSQDPVGRTAVCMQFVLHKWLREDRNVEPKPIHRAQVDNKPIDMWFLYKNGGGVSTVQMYGSYEEAMEVSLQEALKTL